MITMLGGQNTLMTEFAERWMWLDAPASARPALDNLGRIGHRARHDSRTFARGTVASEGSATSGNELVLVEHRALPRCYGFRNPTVR